MNIEELEKLAGLKEKGIITEEQFNQKKQEILGINSSSSIKEHTQNKILLAGMVFVGLIIGIIGTVFSYSLIPTTQKDTNSPIQTTQKDTLCLYEIVFNSDIPQGRERCGFVEPNKGCVLYIMNPKNEDMSGQDFYEVAAQWTGRERYFIETSNMSYASQHIKPGYMAQINIPPLSY